VRFRQIRTLSTASAECGPTAAGEDTEETDIRVDADNLTHSDYLFAVIDWIEARATPA
jgi:hypothetical protein